MPLVIEEVRQHTPAFQFMGTDVTCSLIEKHKQAFAAKSYMAFKCVDASYEPLPSGYDLIFSRDSLQHLPYAAVLSFLKNVKASGARYLLVGSYLNSECNSALCVCVFPPLICAYKETQYLLVGSYLYIESMHNLVMCVWFFTY